MIISAPFGNYVQPTGTTPTLGTFTAMARPGRVRRILASVRYYRRLRAWVNRIGLRNPGIDWLVGKVRAGKIDVADKLVSIHGFEPDQWYALLERAAALGPLGVELNMSCPNVGEVDWPADLFRRAASCGVRVIVKVPPVNYDVLVRQSLEAGLRWLHCCNTLPVPAGGLSGKPLKPVALQCIRDVLANLVAADAGDLTIVGGGGITGPCDVDDYVAAGARHVAIGTKVMNPRYLFSDAGVRPIIGRAASLLGKGGDA